MSCYYKWSLDQLFKQKCGYGWLITRGMEGRDKQIFKSGYCIENKYVGSNPIDDSIIFNYYHYLKINEDNNV